MKITSLKLCNGCHTCYSLCPKQAIKMIANEEGFYILKSMMNYVLIAVYVKKNVLY